VVEVGAGLRARPPLGGQSLLVPVLHEVHAFLGAFGITRLQAPAPIRVLTVHCAAGSSAIPAIGDFRIADVKMFRFRAVEAI
jgi:hypothetical protein